MSYGMVRFYDWRWTPKDLCKLASLHRGYALTRGCVETPQGDFKALYGLYQPQGDDRAMDEREGQVFSCDELRGLAAAINKLDAAGELRDTFSEDEYRANCKARAQRVPKNRLW